MKSIFVLAILFPLALFSQATDNSATLPKSNELGIVFLSVNDLNVWHNGKSVQSSADVRCPVGLMYNRHFGKNTLRFSTDYFVHVIDVNNDADYHYYYRASGADRNLGLNIGYQRDFSIHKLGIAPFADLTYRSQLAVGRESVYGDIVFYENLYFRRQTSWYGARVGVNLSYHINPSIAVSASFSESVDREYYHDLLAGYKSSVHAQLYHFNPLDHIGVAFCF